MSRSDSKIDLAKYMPSPEAVRAMVDERAAQERLQKALDNPELDAALQDLNGQAGAAGVAGVPTVVTVRPMAEIPVAEIPVVGKPVAEKPAAAAAWSTTNKALAAIGLAFLPAVLVFLLFVKPAQPGVVSVATASAATGMLSGGAGVDAALVGVQAPSAESAAPVPSVSAVAPLVPVSPVAPAGRPKVVKDGGDPYDSVPPKTAKTAEVVAPPVPTLAPAAPAISTAPAAPPPTATATVKPIF